MKAGALFQTDMGAKITIISFLRYFLQFSDALLRMADTIRRLMGRIRAGLCDKKNL